VVNGHERDLVGSRAVTLFYDWNAWESATRGEIFRRRRRLTHRCSSDAVEVTQTSLTKYQMSPDCWSAANTGMTIPMNTCVTNNSFVTPATATSPPYSTSGRQDTLLGALIYFF